MSPFFKYENKKYICKNSFFYKCLSRMRINEKNKVKLSVLYTIECMRKKYDKEMMFYVLLRDQIYFEETQLSNNIINL